MLGLALNARLGGFARFNEADDFGKPRFVAQCRRTNVDFTIFDDGACKNAAACCTVHGQRLARHRGLIDGGVACDNDAVGRNHGARADNDRILKRELGERNGFDALSVLTAAHPDLIDLKCEFVGKRRQRLLARVVFKHLAQAQKHNEEADGAEVAPQKRYDQGRGVQHRNIELALKEILDAFGDDGKGTEHGVADVDDHRQHRTQEEVARKA